MKKKISKVLLITATLVMFSSSFLINVHKNAKGDFSFIASAFADDSGDSGDSGSGGSGGSGDSGSGSGTDCNLCVLKDTHNQVTFSCKKAVNESCSKSKIVGSVTCANAKACS